MCIKIEISCLDHDTGRMDLKKLSKCDISEVIQFGGNVEIEFGSNTFTGEENIVQFYFELLRLRDKLNADDFKSFSVHCDDWTQHYGHILIIQRGCKGYCFICGYDEPSKKCFYSKGDILEFINNFESIFKTKIRRKYGRSAYGAIMKASVKYPDNFKESLEF